MTLKLGLNFGKSLSSPLMIAVYGNLGAGKTTFLKGVIQGLTGLSPEEITSPTFVYLNTYQAPHFKIFHFDLYRIKNSDEFIEKGFEEYLTSEGICCVEWSERIEPLLPENAIKINFHHLDENKREIKIANSFISNNPR
jgi:tRNA threonylcarbamoyladenosine biosynthesis protein TsaE